MSQNNTIRKSDKKFIAREKGRIRSQVLDVKKQQELIDNLYKKFLGQSKDKVASEAGVPKVEVKKETEVKPKKATADGGVPQNAVEKTVKKAKAK